MVKLEEESTTRQAALPNAPTYISVSMDAADSTETKRQLRGEASRLGMTPQETYREYSAAINQAQIRFYEKLVAYPDLEIGRLVRMKQIGDEMWFVYSLEGLDSQEIGLHATCVLGAALDHVGMGPLSFVCMQAGADESDERTPFFQGEIHWKFTLDLIDDAIDLTQDRSTKLEEFVARQTAQGKPAAIRLMATPSSRHCSTTWVTRRSSSHVVATRDTVRFGGTSWAGQWTDSFGSPNWPRAT